jgi:hypothetical protein
MRIITKPGESESRETEKPADFALAETPYFRYSIIEKGDWLTSLAKKMLVVVSTKKGDNYVFSLHRVTFVPIRRGTLSWYCPAITHF